MTKDEKKVGQWERVNNVTDNLNRAAWKLQGIAGVIFIIDAGKAIELDGDQANGLSILLEQIAEEIKTNAARIVEVRP
ncbi:MAG TPA: hypothetical protein PK022_09370 [Syntrophales bacterium]|nr:hypothetical protein [Syntrophales bacterium]